MSPLLILASSSIARNPQPTPVTQEQEAACHARLSHINFHRVEHKVCGWSWALGAFTLLIERSPRRNQPGWSWIAIGAGVALTLWVIFTYLLSLYVQTSGSFGSTYGPLTGIIALLTFLAIPLVWTLLPETRGQRLDEGEA